MSELKPNTFSIEKFDGNNWLTWKNQMKGAFMFSTTWGVVEGTNRKPVIAAGATATPEQAEAISKWMNLDERARGLILMYTEPKFHHQIIDLPSAKEMWDALVEEYDSPGTMDTFIMW